jgi:hypothetical protein
MNFCWKYRSSSACTTTFIVSWKCRCEIQRVSTISDLSSVFSVEIHCRAHRHTNIKILVITFKTCAMKCFLPLADLNVLITNTRTYFIACCAAVGEIKGTVSDSLYRLHCKGYCCMFYHVWQVKVNLYRRGISCPGYGVFLRRPFKSFARLWQ